jgi:hypothetical protein
MSYIVSLIHINKQVITMVSFSIQHDRDGTDTDDQPVYLIHFPDFFI